MMFNLRSKIQRQTESKTRKRWQLFNATDFQSLMYPCFSFCRILGAFPYKINASTFESCKLHYILWSLFLCAYCITELIILHRIITLKIDFGGIFRTLEALSVYIFGSFIVIVTYVLSSPRMRVLQAMLEISSKVSPESYQKLSRWIHVKDILGTFLLIIQGCVYYYRMSEPLEYCVFEMYTFILIFNMDMQYMNCVCVLKACFKRINVNLVHLQNVMIKNKPHAPRSICGTQKNQLLLTELKTLKKQHLIICNTMHMLNEIFNLQLLATTAITFTEGTFEMYFHIMKWQDNSGLSIIVVNEFRDVFFVISVAHELVKLILIAWACETRKNQAFEIGTTVHDVFNYTKDEQIKEELHLFSLQILHCARNTFFTKGLCVDATLLTAVASNITTYILILAQFTIISHSC